MTCLRSSCIDHGCKGMGLGYATAWIKLPCGTKYSSTKHRRVHYEATGELPEVVRHKCDNPRCINPEHLESGTYVDNMRDCKERGRLCSGYSAGEANTTSKVTDAEVALIRKLYVKGSRTAGLRVLAERFGLGTSQVHRIVKQQGRMKSGTFTVKSIT